MPTHTPAPAAVEAFQSFYLAELDKRVKRSDVVGSITLKKGNAALYFESTEGKFTLVEHLPDVEEANIFDCVPREQWGRKVMLLGYATQTGEYIPCGHATLDGNTLKIKLAYRYYRIEVGSTLAHLLPFAGEPPQDRQEPVGADKRPPARTPRNQERPNGKLPAPGTENTAQVSRHSAANDECEDLTEEDLRRLRGEMPLTSKSKKKWQH
jgi:hypothetical protein